eukprot:s200_g6.t1
MEAAPRPVGLLDTLEVHEAQAATAKPLASQQTAMAPGELQLSYESDCVVVRWCVDLRRLCSQYRYGLSRRFVVRFTEEVPFVLFLNPAASAGAFSTADLRATMQVKCTDPCQDMPHLQMLFGVDDQPAAVVEDHDFQVEPLCAAQGTTWQLGDTTAILRVELCPVIFWPRYGTLQQYLQPQTRVDFGYEYTHLPQMRHVYAFQRRVDGVIRCKEN